jgi:hypothetical protein
MVKNNHYKLEKCTLARWVDKALEHALIKKNIKNGFKVVKICPYNPKEMDDKIKPIDVYIVEPNFNMKHF